MSGVAGELTAISSLVEADPLGALRRAVQLLASNPLDEAAACLLTDVGEKVGKDAREPAPGPSLLPEVAHANELIIAGQIEQAEIVLRRHLAAQRHDPPAMHLMAEIAARCGFPEDCSRILARSREIHANSAEAWAGLGMTLHRIAVDLDQPDLVEEAAQALERALALRPDYEAALAYRASLLLQLRRLDESLATFERLVDLAPEVSAHWMNFGYLLKTTGEFGLGLAAARVAVALDSRNGAAWWNLANLKRAKLYSFDVDRMTAALKDDGIDDDSRVSIHYALAAAEEQAGNHEETVRHLDVGGALRMKVHPPDLSRPSEVVDTIRKVFTREFFEERSGWGHPAKDPIFIVGMPRAGSTLLEQILSSHSMIEGTEELLVVQQLGAELASENPGKAPEQIFARISRHQATALGERFMSSTRRYRETERPRFTDKYPQNWQYAGLIRLMLPNAKIIDIRRNPLDCCFANYAQHFNAGVNYSYSQKTLGEYYSSYVQAMRHFDAVVPGLVHRVIYEDLVEDLETQVRLLLDYLELPFEDRCLRFYETKRAVHTPSSEQVRQPINRSGLGRGKPFEPWLGELISALGNELQDWRR